jgi:hypothetical protein
MGSTPKDEVEGIPLQAKAEGVVAQFASYNTTLKYQDGCDLFEAAAVHLSWLAFGAKPQWRCKYRPLVVSAEGKPLKRRLFTPKQQSCLCNSFVSATE